MSKFFLTNGLLALMAMLLLFSCTKYDDRLDTQNRDSGIINTMKDGRPSGEGFIDEVITVYAKIGEPSAELKIYVSDEEAEILTRGRAMKYKTSDNGVAVPLPVDTFNIIIPRTARIGAGNIYFSLDGEIKPSLNFLVKRPDILIPNKVWVEPFLFAYSDSTARPGGWDYIFPDLLKDGGSGEAVVNIVGKLAYDRDRQVFYFLDYQRGTKTMYIRQLKDGVVTTLAGGGSDYLATTGANLKLSTELYNPSSSNNLDMRPGPDGKLYFVNYFKTDTDPATNRYSNYSLIQRLDPVTRQVEIVLGGSRMSIDNPSRTSNNYRGLLDGRKDTALIWQPNALCFDQQGILYFLDGVASNNGVLLRRLTHEGMVETVLGKVNKTSTPVLDAKDGKTYIRLNFSAINENSDGFGDEVRFTGGTNLVQAGNGKFYILKGSILEVNMDTREASTIVGLPAGFTGPATGTFKEVQLGYASTFDVDFDGNILYGFTDLFKMDLQAETISRMTSFQGFPPEYTSERQFTQRTQPGTNCILGRLNRVVFDQFGNLYAGYDQVAASADVRIARIVIEK